MPTTRRGTFAGALSIARYNWPLYATAGAVLIGGSVVASLAVAPTYLRWTAALGAAVALWFAGASFLAFHWIFDRSDWTRWHWLPGALGRTPARWVHVSGGLEEAETPLAQIFPGAEGKVLDVYDPASMTEPAIARARRQQHGVVATPARMDALPIEAGWADAAVVVLAAHEVRGAGDRERFFRELTRILSPGGKLVLVEHPRNLAAALAFGPAGFLHFLPRREWLRLAALNRLEVESERQFTPFVRVFVLKPGAVSALLA